MLNKPEPWACGTLYKESALAHDIHAQQDEQSFYHILL
jgi:hypothetical protein